MSESPGAAWAYLLGALDIGALMLAMLAGGIVLANWRHYLHFIDGLFEAEPLDAPATLSADLRDLVPPELSAAEVRKQTEILRSLKEQIDAEADAARATIRRARVQAQQQQI